MRMAWMVFSFFSFVACRKEAPPPPAPPVVTPDASVPMPTAFGQLSGTVTYGGPAIRTPIAGSSDPYCGGRAITDDLVLVKDGLLQNAVVRLKDDPGGRTVPDLERQAVLIRQEGCSYDPRISWAVKGMTLFVENNDGTLHNVHAYRAGGATWFNVAQVPGTGRIRKRLDAEGPTKFACDVHPWMKAYVAVSPHAYAAVTDEGGRFDLGRVPAGTHTLVVWHEHLGTKILSITVRPDETAIVVFAY